MEGRAAVRESELEKRADRDLVKSTTASGNPARGMQQPRAAGKAGAEQKTASQKRMFGLWWGKKLAMSQQHALAAEAANCILGCSSKAGASRARGVIIPLHQAPVRMHLLQLSVPSFKVSKRHSRC